MIDDILALLQLFSGRVPDAQTHAWVLELAGHSKLWPRAHDIFDAIRVRNIAAIARKDHMSECQYSFEEVCLKSIYNETDTAAPFDSDSPHWLSKCALELARAVGVSDDEVVEILAPKKKTA